jgi:hypothetical protein
MKASSNLHNSSRTALSTLPAFAFGESFTRRSGVTVNKPQSNARSCRAFKQRPFRGLVRFFTSTPQGMM